MKDGHWGGKTLLCAFCVIMYRKIVFWHMFSSSKHPAIEDKEEYQEKPNTQESSFSSTSPWTSRYICILKLRNITTNHIQILFLSKRKDLNQLCISGYVSSETWIFILVLFVLFPLARWISDFRCKLNRTFWERLIVNVGIGSVYIFVVSIHSHP